MAKLNVGPLSPHTAKFLTYVPHPASFGIHNVSSESDSDVKSLTTEFSELFNRDMGTVKNFEAKFELAPDAKPKIFKPRSVPIA